MTSTPASPATPQLVTPPDIAARLAAGERVVILVTDYPRDPTRQGTVPRLVTTAATGDDLPPAMRAIARGRWVLYFAGPARRPAILMVKPDVLFELTTDDPAPGLPDGPAGPRPLPPLVDITPEERALMAEAHEAGRERGFTHANYAENVSGADPTAESPDIPLRFAAVADSFESGWADGIDAYADSETGAYEPGQRQ